MCHNIFGRLFSKSSMVFDYINDNELFCKICQKYIFKKDMERHVRDEHV